MKILGVVTARGGSKRMPGKNIALLGGKPLIAWSIEVGHKTCDKVVTSTDDQEIATVAREHGTDVVFCPYDLSDPAMHYPQLMHATRTTIDATGESFDAVALLQPTSPFRLPEDVLACVRRMEETRASVVISVVPFAAKNTLFTMGFAGRMRCLTYQATSYNGMQSRIVRENGAVFLIRTDHLLGGGDVYGPQTYAHVMPEDRSLDIDTRSDFDAAVLHLETMRAPAG